MDRLPTRKGLNCLRIEANEVTNLEARQLARLCPVVNPRATHFEIASDVLSVPERFRALGLGLTWVNPMFTYLGAGRKPSSFSSTDVSLPRSTAHNAQHRT